MTVFGQFRICCGFDLCLKNPSFHQKDQIKQLTSPSVCKLQKLWQSCHRERSGRWTHTAKSSVFGKEFPWLRMATYISFARKIPHVFLETQTDFYGETTQIHFSMPRVGNVVVFWTWKIVPVPWLNQRWSGVNLDSNNKNVTSSLTGTKKELVLIWLHHWL